jgi:probable phosphoglycerate mutase
MTYRTGDSTSLPELTAREVCQALREVTFGRRTMNKVAGQTCDEVCACHLVVDVEGWRITLHTDCDTLDYCGEALCPDGRRWAFDLGDRYGTDPVALLSTWEHQTLEKMLNAL